MLYCTERETKICGMNLFLLTAREIMLVILTHPWSYCSEGMC